MATFDVGVLLPGADLKSTPQIPKQKRPGAQTPSRSNRKPEAQALNLNPHGLNPLAGVSGFVALGLGFRVLRWFRG